VRWQGRRGERGKGEEKRGENGEGGGEKEGVGKRI